MSCLDIFMEEIRALVLAGGESRRMGSPKMLLPFRGMTMVERVISNIKGSGLEDIYVVLGAEKERISAVLKNHEVKTCYNVNFREGMLSSVICGIKCLPETTRAVLVFQGDEPLISPLSIRKVIESYLSSGKGLVIPVCEGRRGHPLLIDRKYFRSIEELDHSRGLRALSEKHNDDIAETETGDPGILKDFDTFEEYTKEINQIS